MSNDLENYIATPDGRRRRTQEQSRQNDSNSECANYFPTPLQPACVMDSSASEATHKKSETSNSPSKCIVNGCNVRCESDESERTSVFSADRAALYRNIYQSSSSEDEDEHCVYTYKGAEVGSDLPNAFLHLDVTGQSRENTSARSSPEMDFLEMDFDPGPSNGQDSDSDSPPYRLPPSYDHLNTDLRPTLESADRVEQNESDNVSYDTYDENANCCADKSFITSETAAEGSSNGDVEIFVKEMILRGSPCCSKSLVTNDNDTCGSLKPSTSNYSDLSSDEEASPIINNLKNHHSSGTSNETNELEIEENISDQKLSEDSDSEDITFVPNGYNPIEFNENSNENVFENLCDISFVNVIRNRNDFISYDDLLPLDPSYSISAVVNVMKLLNDFEFDEKEKLANLLQPKLVSECTPLVEYLLMRSVQNTNEVDLSKFAAIISENKLYSRFFSTYPDAHFNLVEWLYSWMRKGAVPVVTRNIQERGTLASRDIVRNPWRHNVVYKLESPYIHVSNPHERVLDCVLHSQLSQPSLVYVKRKCILQKWHSKVDLRSLMRANHNRWYNENVLGQVATIIRENDSNTNYTKYVRIPSNCRCGITLFVPSENLTLCREIDEATELSATVCH